MLLIECGSVLLAVLIAFIFPTVGSRWFESLERGFARFARRRGLAVLVVGLTALALRAALLPILPIPAPAITDEFSYLLMADTFAHGRMTNPTHPMWIHFESFAIIQKPTYCSAFYPAQGLLMAVGQVIGGHPFWGMWFSIGAMCAAICWMLQAWLPARWAMLGGLLAAVRLGSFSYWATTYDGGTVAAIGGALALGALPRIRRQQHARDALLMGLGLAILVNSRPYEGLFLSLPVGAALLVWLLSKNAPPLKLALQRILLPLFLMLLATVVAMGYYFWRTTGSPFNTPYLVNLRTYFVVPNFPWSRLGPMPKYNHAVMERFYTGWPLGAYELARKHAILLAVTKAVSLGFFFLGPLLALPFVMLGIALPQGMSFEDIDDNTRFLLFVCGVSFVGLLLPIYFNPHYAAPITGAIYALVLLATRRLVPWCWQGKRTGLALIRFIPVMCVFLLLLRAAAGPLHISLPEALPASWWRVGPQNLSRAQVLSRLQRDSEQHLVIVRYSATHYLNIEWVYNSADIDKSKVIWARDMPEAQNEELVRYFKGRRVWLLDPDEVPPKLSSYHEDRWSQ